MMKERLSFSKKRVGTVILCVLFAVLLALPLIARTSTYPVAVVQGNSMHPGLQNGELIFFAAPRGPIQNGSVVVFVQSSSGIPALDAFLKPIVIHRVVAVGQEPNGIASYQTKGDNNLAKDPFTTDASQVLGVPVLEIPYLGLPILFLQTPYGLVAVTALLCLFFLSNVDTKLDKDEEQKRLLAVFAKRALNGEISTVQFEKLKLAIEYFGDIPVDFLKDPAIVSVVDWLKAGGLETRWKEEQAICPNCNGSAFRIVSGSKFFLICPHCSDGKSSVGGLRSPET